MLLKGQNAVVTGAGDGIGKAIALRLAEAGVNVAALDIDGEKASHTCTEIRKLNCLALPLTVDVSESAQVKQTVKTILDEWVTIHILVNNAAISPKKDGVRASLIDMEEEEWDHVIKVNLTGIFYMCKYCLPNMISNRYGKVVNMSSVAGKMGGFAAGIHYASSKAGILGFTKTLAREGAPYGINANVVMPSRISTKLGRSIPVEMLEKRLAQIPLGRFGTPKDAAEAVLFLVSHKSSSWITGATLNLSGGLLMD